MRENNKAPSLQLSPFQKTEVSGPVEDDVVQQLDAEDCPRSLKLGGNGDVVGRWFETSAGVVVGDDDPRGAIRKRIGEDFARMNRTAVNEANRNDADVQNFVRPVDRGAEKCSCFRSA